MEMILLSFALKHPVAFLLFIIGASFIILLKAADYLVSAVTSYAKKLGISDYLIGVIIIALGASLPELISSLMGVVANESGIIFGTIVGSNICGLTLVLGMLAIVGKRIPIKVRVLKKTGIIIFALSMLPFIFALNGVIGKIEGSVLVLCWIAYNFFLWKKEGELGKIKHKVALKKIWHDGLIAVIALLAIILSGRWLVFSSIKLSELLMISPYVIAVTVLGLGTQIPDLAVSLRGLKKGHQDIAFADILGSLITKSLLFLGIFSLLIPLRIKFLELIGGFIFTGIALGYALICTRKGVIKSLNGLLLIILYLGFFGYVLVISRLI